MRSAVAAILLLGMLPGPAVAAQVALNCAFTSSTDDLTKYVLANQFIFDTDAQTLDMRVANSKMNWFFVTQKTEFIDDVFHVRFGKDGLIAAAGLRNSVPFAFRLTAAGQLDFTYFSPDAAERIQWQCSRSRDGSAD